MHEVPVNDEGMENSIHDQSRNFHDSITTYFMDMRPSSVVGELGRASQNVFQGRPYQRGSCLTMSPDSWSEADLNGIFGWMLGLAMDA